MPIDETQRTSEEAIIDATSGLPIVTMPHTRDENLHFPNLNNKNAIN